MEDKKASTLNKAVSILFAISLVFLIISFSISLPIYFRSFYYIHIEALDIEASTGHTKAELKEAFNELMDYLTLGKEFGVGVFEYSERGKSHFHDCKVLFALNTATFILSFVICATIIAIYKIKKKKTWHPFDLNISFFAAVGTLLAFAITGVIVSIDFTRAFKFFHRIVFPGKTNWTFIIENDPIILALPLNFFINCAILILASIISICASIIAVSLIKRKRDRKYKLRTYTSSF